MLITASKHLTDSMRKLETFSSLRFGQRAKKVKNNALVNVQYSVEELEKRVCCLCCSLGFESFAHCGIARACQERDASNGEEAVSS